MNAHLILDGALEHEARTELAEFGEALGVGELMCEELLDLDFELGAGRYPAGHGVVLLYAVGDSPRRPRRLLFQHSQDVTRRMGQLTYFLEGFVWSRSKHDAMGVRLTEKERRAL